MIKENILFDLIKIIKKKTFIEIFLPDDIRTHSFID